MRRINTNSLPKLIYTYILQKPIIAIAISKRTFTRPIVWTSQNSTAYLSTGTASPAEPYGNLFLGRQIGRTKKASFTACTTVAMKPVSVKNFAAVAPCRLPHNSGLDEQTLHRSTGPRNAPSLSPVVVNRLGLRYYVPSQSLQNL